MVCSAIWASIRVMLSLMTPLPASASSTARQALKDVVAQVRTWRADAVLPRCRG